MFHDDKNTTTAIGAGIQLRPHQMNVMRAFDNGQRKIILVWARRLGKTILSWLLLIREAVRKPGVYWYCFNNYSTAYNDVWVAMTSSGVKFLSMIPAGLVVRSNSEKMEIELANGSIIKLIGINNSDKLVGAGLSGVVFDEYALLNETQIKLITAMLAETGGWQVIISTPRGKNHLYIRWQFALAHPDIWWSNNLNYGDLELAAYLAPGFLEQERLEIISEYGNDALYQQEYLTSWVSPNSGSVFGDLMNILRQEERFTPLSPAKNNPCYAAYDLGNADYTAIVLFQVDERGFPLVLDHIENRNEEVKWYVEEMRRREWRVHTHFLPHDAAYHKGARNETYRQVLGMYGIRNTVVLPKPHRVSDKLNFLRRVFSGMRIDSSLERVAECLDKLEYEWNDKLCTWSDKPTHKGSFSDTVDGLCYMAQAIQKYGLTSQNIFTQSRIVQPNNVLNTTKQQRLDALLKAELSFNSGNKKVVQGDCFI